MSKQQLVLLLCGLLFSCYNVFRMRVFKACEYYADIGGIEVKKSIMLPMLVAMCCAFSAVWAAPKTMAISVKNFISPQAAPLVLSVLNVQGLVTNVGSEKITVKDDKSGQSIDLTVMGTTYLVNNAERQKVAAFSFKKGDFISVFYSAAQTKAQPLQGKAVLVLLGQGDWPAEYLRVSRTKKDGNDLSAYYDDKVMHIGENAMRNNTSIRQGDEVVAWYAPGAVGEKELNAIQALLLNRTVDDIVINTVSGGIEIMSSALPTEGNTKIYRIDGNLYLPLRPVAHRLGYQLGWNQQTQSTTLKKGVRDFSLKTGSKEYNDGKIVVVLPYAPQLVDGVTVVPWQFFRDVLDRDVKIL